MAYPNATINEGGFGTFQVDAASDIALYQRLYFTTTAGDDGKPTLAICGATDRADCVAMQPGSKGDFITVRFVNAQGEQFGLASGTIGTGAPVYQAAAGALTASSAGGALLVGKSTTAGFDGGPFTYLEAVAAA